MDKLLRQQITDEYTLYLMRMIYKITAVAAPAIITIFLFVTVMKMVVIHDDVIEWKQFLRYWPFVRGIHRSPVNSPHKGQWRGALMFSLICVWINGWVNIFKAGDLRRYHAHYDIIVMRKVLAFTVIMMITIMLTVVIMNVMTCV